MTRKPLPKSLIEKYKVISRYNISKNGFLGLIAMGLTEIPDDIPNTVKILNLRGNQIAEIKNIPASVKILELSYNNITDIDNIPASIKNLYLSNNEITEIKNIPDSVEVVDLSNNKITEIKNLENGIMSLHLKYTNITHIDISELPASLTFLWVISNKYIDNLDSIKDELRTQRPHLKFIIESIE